MNDAKEAILRQIRSGLGRGPLPESAKIALREALASPARSILPARVDVGEPERIREFIRMTTGEATTVAEADTEIEVPAAAAAFLEAHDLPKTVVLAPDPGIRRMPWAESDLQVRFGRAEKDDLTSVTPAFSGIAETGCLMLVSGPSHPYTLNFLPENHIAVLKRSRIVATPEDAFALLRTRFGPGRMPRAALMAAGPSRSADIGATLQFGAHGPRRVHCILVN